MKVTKAQRRLARKMMFPLVGFAIMAATMAVAGSSRPASTAPQMSSPATP